jgi:hypothetical protein
MCERLLMARKGNTRSTTAPLKYLLLLLLGLVILIPSAGSAQTFGVVYNFQYPGPVGPLSGVTIDGAGNLYGTTAYSYNGTGAVYKLALKNGEWILSTLLQFDYGNGNTPAAPPAFGPDGNLYGTTYEGGGGCDLGCGNVYNLRPSINPCKTALCYWNGNSLYDFGNIQNDGVWPVFVDLLFDPAGNIYGTTSFNVPSGNGCC